MYTLNEIKKKECYEIAGEMNNGQHRKICTFFQLRNFIEIVFQIQYEDITFGRGVILTVTIILSVILFGYLAVTSEITIRGSVYQKAGKFWSVFHPEYTLGFIFHIYIWTLFISPHYLRIRRNKSPYYKL